MTFHNPRTRLPLLLPVALGALLAGCTSLLSQSSLNQVTPRLSPAAVLAEPGRHVGQTLVIAGPVLQVDNTAEGTLVEVLGYPTTSSGRPDTSEPAIGRFLLRHPGFLDPLIYTQGRDIAAVARVVGQRERPVGATVRTEPLLDVIEIKLLQEPASVGLPVRIGVGFGFGF